MTTLPSAAEIAELTQFLRHETDMRETVCPSGREDEYLAPAERALEIAERLPALVAEIERLKAGYAKNNDDVCQSLGKVLGYPWFKDDQATFPGATEKNGVCVGDHIAASIAEEAAKALLAARAERDQALAENRLIAFYKKHLDEAIAAYQSVWEKLDQVERVKRENAAMRTTLGRIHRETGATFHGSAADRAIGLVHTLAGAQLDAPSEKMAEEAPPLTVDYANWRGERRIRNIIPLRPFHGSNEWHEEPQWLLEAIDHEDGKVKTFAFAGFHGFGEPAEEGELRTPYTPRITVFPQARVAEFVIRDEPTLYREVDAEMGVSEVLSMKDMTVIGMCVDLSALAAARQTIAEAVEVMRPFAKFPIGLIADDARAAELGLPPDNDDDVVYQCHGGGNVIVKHFRAARAFVEAHGEKEAE